MHLSSFRRSPSSRPAVPVSLLAVATLLSACSGGSPGGTPAAPATPLPSPAASSLISPSPAAFASAGPTPTPTPAAPGAGAAKNALEGLVAMGPIGFYEKTASVPDNGMEEIGAHPGVYKGAVINVTWAQLEPQRDVFDDSAIASALATIATYDETYPGAPVAAKLRVWAGNQTPAWVFAIAGGPIAISGNNNNLQIAPFWTPAYDTLWRGLQDHLAAQYDAGGAIAETTVNSCASRTDEPFVASLDPASLANLHAAGFDDAAYEACLTGAMDDYAAWKRTPLDFAFNSFPSSDAGRSANPAFTTQVMTAWRSALGARGVVANHGLQSPLAAGAQPVYTDFATLGAPIELQGYAPTIDWNGAISVALTYHPSEIEIWQTQAAGGQANLTQAQLQQYAAELP